MQYSYFMARSGTLIRSPGICFSTLTHVVLFFFVQLSHFRFEDTKTRVTPHHHIFEEVIEKHQPLFSVVDEFDSDYGDDDDYPMPPYLDMSDYDEQFLGGYDYYYDDDYGFYDIDGPMNGCIIS